MTSIGDGISPFMVPGVAVLEARILATEKGTVAGYFDDIDRCVAALEKAADQFNGQSNFYIVMNPVDPACLARATNRLVPFARFTTSDRDVLQRRFLLLDFDPVRPKGVSSTADELQRALSLRDRVIDWLTTAGGWPDPIRAMSGNGGHADYRIDLPNDERSRDLIKRALGGLARMFDTPQVTIDPAVYNASRIIKVYGTVARKGDATAERPHRRAIIESRPASLGVVTSGQLVWLTNQAAPPRTKPRGGRSTGDEHRPERLDMVAEFQHRGWYLNPLRDGKHAVRCPWIDEHSGESGPTETVLFEPATAEAWWGFKCQHAHCAERTIRDVWELSRPRGKASPDVDWTARSHVGEMEPWADRKPISAELRPVPRFDPETLLPGALCAWVMDEADRMPCPPDFIAAATIVALGSIIGARCAIRPKARDSWLIVPNVWGAIVGDVAAKKTPAWSAALSPLDRLVAKALQAYEHQSLEYESARVVYEAQKEAIEWRIREAAKKKGDPKSIAQERRAHVAQAPVAPTPRRYKTNDSTVEKLGELLRDNPGGVLVLRDELVGLIASWDREGREGDRAFFLEAWNGNQSFDTDRISRGHVLIPNLCLSIFGGIQPDKLTAYLEQAHTR
ncbi:MAG: hypothetical protein C5B57_07600 [Blastocatellia bacterium]|nr:MAG: hypothetical protein C5B57_07600 [Blastocatellia bacterium]